MKISSTAVIGGQPENTFMLFWIRNVLPWNSSLMNRTADVGIVRNTGKVPIIQAMNQAQGGLNSSPYIPYIIYLGWRDSLDTIETTLLVTFVLWVKTNVHLGTSEVGSFPMNMKYVTPLSEQSLQRNRRHSHRWPRRGSLVVTTMWRKMDGSLSWPPQRKP